MRKKGTSGIGAVWLIPTVVIALVLGGIVAGVGLEVLGSVRTDQAETWCSANSYWWNVSDDTCRNVSTSPNAVQTPVSAEYNGTGNAITGVAEVPERMDTMGLVIAVSIILSILVGGFAYFKLR